MLDKHLGLRYDVFEADMKSNEQIKTLFRAFRDRNDAAFLKAADAIIAEELAANHHAFATELENILKKQRNGFPPTTINELSFLPKDRRNGEQLISLHESNISQDKIVLAKETRQKIDRILDEYRKSSLLAKYGYTPKTKLLFWGPPGCGKTFTAYHIANELGLPVGVLRLSAVISSFLGDTASHLQRVFDLANSTPMVLLLDEIDAVGKNRDDRNDVGELKRVVNSLLQSMDAFKSTKSIVISASNHQYLLDPALWRRFDDLVQFPLPGKADREKYIERLLNGISYDGSFANLAKMMSALSFADIEKIVIAAIKSMILSGRETLNANDISEEIKSQKYSFTHALIKKEELSIE